MKVLGWLLRAPFRVLYLLVLLAEDGGDADAEIGRKRALGRHHPTAHLPRHNR